VVVALLCLQYRVADPQIQRRNTILQTRTAKKRLPPFFGFGLSRAPIRTEGLDRKNTIIGKHFGKQPHRITGGFAQAGFTSRGQF